MGKDRARCFVGLFLSRKKFPSYDTVSLGATPAGKIDTLEDNALANTYVQCLMHVVFSTKERRQIIPRESQSRLWAYMGGICKKEGVFVREIGGMPDHVHLLIQQPPTMALSDIVLNVKAASSQWMGPKFAWQRGFGAFKPIATNAGCVVHYIID